MSLADYRKKIDALDERIIKALNQRAKVSQQIGKHKTKNKAGIYVSSREQQVLKRIKMLNDGPMTDEAVEAVYREIMSASLSLEKSLRIAYLGPEASFTNLAALRKFGSQVSYVSSSTISEVFRKVENGKVALPSSVYFWIGKEIRCAYNGPVFLEISYFFFAWSHQHVTAE